MVKIEVTDEGQVMSEIDVDDSVKFTAQTYAVLCVLLNEWQGFMAQTGYTHGFTFGDMLDIMNAFTKTFDVDPDINIFENISIDYDGNRGYRFTIKTDEDKVLIFPTKEIKS